MTVQNYNCELMAKQYLMSVALFKSKTVKLRPIRQPSC